MFIVRPSQKSDEISLYGEYLDCDPDGNVKDCTGECSGSSLDNPSGRALQSLSVLINNYICNDNNRLPIILMGFSRGGLVLNQILVELGASLFSDCIMTRVREIHWLDCGNGNHHLCYPPLSPAVLTSLQYYCGTLRCFFHLTPYLYAEDLHCKNYAEDLHCKNYAELSSLIQQLQSVGVQTWTHFYTHEFEWRLGTPVIRRKYGHLSLLSQHFSLLLEFQNSISCCNKHTHFLSNTTLSIAFSIASASSTPHSLPPHPLSHSSFCSPITSM